MKDQAAVTPGPATPQEIELAALRLDLAERELQLCDSQMATAQNQAALMSVQRPRLVEAFEKAKTAYEATKAPSA